MTPEEYLAAKWAAPIPDGPKGITFSISMDYSFKVVPMPKSEDEMGQVIQEAMDDVIARAKFNLEEGGKA